jgi:hypothetical protein
MNRDKWNKFVKIRDNFRRVTEELSASLPELKSVQQAFADSRPEGKNAAYAVETPVVYNTALDDVNISDEIKLILVADNPGRREQAAENIRYLVGPSGKIARKFFSDNPELEIDFRKNVIILNKTPIHTPRTVELRQLCRLGEEMGLPGLSSALEESQKKMAKLLLEFHEALDVQVWITGYSEMKKGGIFEVYTENLKELYAKKTDLYKQLFFFRHFSMNQFTIDLKQQTLEGESLTKSLNRIGAAYRYRILGF